MSIGPLPADHDDAYVDPHLIIGDDKSQRGDELHNSLANRLWVSHNVRGKYISNSNFSCNFFWVFDNLVC